MITTQDDKDRDALRGALLTLEQIAKRSTDQSSRALADGAAADLRARVPADLLSPPAGAKHCVKCGRVISAPWLASDEPERCAQRAD